MSLTTIRLLPDASHIEVMRRFRRQPGTQILRAKHTRGDGANSDYWSIQFIGPMPELSGLIHEVAP